MVSKLLDLAKRSAVIEYAEVPFSTVLKVNEFTGHLCSHVVRTTQETGQSYFGISSRQGLIVDYNVAKHRATKFDTSGLKFELIPRQLLRAWADNSWLGVNFRSAEEWKNGANPDKVVSIPC